MLKKTFLTVITAIFFCGSLTSYAFAEGWEKDQNGWYWMESDGTFFSNGWRWLDGNQDGIAECYYFKPDGYCLLETITPDGYTVNADGAWIVDGAVQTKAMIDKESAINIVKQNQQDSVSTIFLDTAYNIDLNNDGIVDRLFLTIVKEPEDTYRILGIYYNDKYLEYKVENGISSMYLMRKDGKSYLYLEKYGFYEIHNTDIFGFENGTIEIRARDLGGFYNFIPESVNDFQMIEAWASPFLQHDIARSYHVGKDGLPEPNEEEYRVLYSISASPLSGEAELLSAKQEVPAYNPITGEYKPIPAYTKLDEVYTDQFTYSVLQDRTTGELYQIPIVGNKTKSEYSREYFDGVIFRG